jgi:hypothetical protein
MTIYPTSTTKYINNEFLNKIKLYCKLHGESIDNMNISNQCDKCRKKHNGICNIGYYNHQVLYHLRSRNILQIQFSNIPKEYVGGHYNHIKIGGLIYRTVKINWGWFCFGFLAPEDE